MNTLTHLGGGGSGFLVQLLPLLGGEANALFAWLVLLRVLVTLEVSQNEYTIVLSSGPYALEVLGVNVALFDAAANLFLDLGMVAARPS